MEIKYTLKIIRIIRGYSQKYVASNAGISVLTYRRYETGEVIPRYDILKKICNILEFPVDEIEI